MVAVSEVGTTSRPKSEAKTLRVLHVVPQLGVGGMENGVLNIIDRLPEIDHVICAMRSTRSTSQRIEAHAARTSTLDCHGRFSIKKLAAHFREARPDVVHSRNWGAIESVMAAKLAGIPVVHSEHGYELGMESGLSSRQRLFRAASYRAANAVVTVSEELREFHSRQAFFPADKIGVITNGVDIRKFRPDTQLRKQVRAELQIASDAMVIVSVGRLIALKDHATLIRAMYEMSTANTGVVAVIVGDGPERPRLEALVAELGLGKKILFTGERSDVASLLSAADVFCLPSFLEGMSNTVLEAMSAGLPVVATEVGANGEIVVHGECGLLIKPRHCEALSSALLTLVNDRERAERMGRAARQRVEQSFSLERMISEYEKLYTEVASRRQRR